MSRATKVIIVVTTQVLLIALWKGGLADCIDECKAVQARYHSGHGADDCFAYETKRCEIESGFYVEEPSEGSYKECRPVDPEENTLRWECIGNCTDPCPAITISEMTPPNGYDSGACGSTSTYVTVFECILPPIGS